MSMIGVLLNPHAGKGKPLKLKKKIREYLVGSGHTPVFKCTKFKGHEREIVKEFIDEGVRTIIIMGGDGTINESLPSLVGRQINILPLPMGSGDDYVRTIYGTTDLGFILEKLKDAKTKTVPVGEVNAEGDFFYFINGLGIGFDAEVLVNMKKFPLFKGPLQYLMSIISTIFFYSAEEISFVYKGIIDTRKILLVTVGLGKFLGGGFKLLPKANPGKHKFDASIINEVNKLLFFRLLPKAKNGEHLGSKYVNYVEGIRSLIIKSKEAIKFHLDGELMPVKYKRIEIFIKCEGVSVII